MNSKCKFSFRREVLENNIKFQFHQVNLELPVSFLLKGILHILLRKIIFLSLYYVFTHSLMIIACLFYYKV